MDRETFRHILALSGIGAKRAEALYEAGFQSVEDLRDASLEELRTVPGIGEKLARRIKDAFKEKEEEEGIKIYLCPNCGAFVSEDDRICPKCGISLSEEEEVGTDEETEEIKEHLEEKADGYWYKKDSHKLLICPECGAFVSEIEKVCPKCGTLLEEGNENEIKDDISAGSEESEGEADGYWYKKEDYTLLLCPECGAFVSEDDLICPKCGISLEGEEEIESAGESSEIEGILEEKADGYWYKKDEHRLVMCPECGAFVSEIEKVCPKCGTILEGEEELDLKKEEGAAGEADGYWYKKDEHRLVMCPECGAFIDEDAELCPKCGASFEKEVEEIPTTGKTAVPASVETPPEPEDVSGLLMSEETEESTAMDEAPDLGKEGSEPSIHIKGIPEESILDIRIGKEMPEREYRGENVPELSELLVDEKERSIEEEPEEEEMEEPEPRTGIESMGEDIDGLFSKKSEKKGVSQEFASRWENLVRGKPYGPETALEVKKPVETDGKREESGEKKATREVRSISSIPPYSGKGLTNGNIGRTNGAPRYGYRNGEIRVTNGRINGRTNGLTNGVTNGKGLINGGLVNGNGFINGGENLTPGIMEEKPLKKSLVPITLLLVLLIVTPLLMSFLIMPVPKEIEVGGGFGDWHDVIEYPDSTTDQPYDNNINFEALKVYQDWGGLALYARIVQSGRLFETGPNGVSSILMFIDSDSSVNTGYYVKGIGADYMIDVDGWNGTYHRHTLYAWNSSRSQNDWNGWVSERSVPVNNNQREMETKVSLEDAHNPKVVFASRDRLGNEDFSDIIISTQRGALRADETSIGPAIIQRDSETAMLRLDMRAYGSSVEIRELRFGVMGDGTVSALNLYEDSNDNGVHDREDRLIRTSVPADGESLFRMDMTVNLQRNTTLLATVTTSSAAPAEEAVNIYLESISLAHGSVTIVPHLSGGSYIESIPASPVVDGSFHDWDSILKNPDAAGDVMPADNPNIDIAEYAVWPHNGLSFYVNVDGNMLGGEDMPFTKHRPRPILDHDHDGIPDANDTYPNDFDNDGIPDSQDRDRDNDGVNDNPGPDRWLNNTFTGASIYVGPVEIPVLEGYDYVMLFVDIDGNMSTGYRAPWLPMGADYLIRIEGRAMRINSSALLIFTGNTQNIWNWSSVEDAQAAMGEHEIECGIENLSVNANSSFFIYTTDWEKNRDMGDGILHGTRAISGNSVSEDGSVTKTLHMHSDDSLDTFAGNATVTTTINDGSSHTWTQSPPFAKDFHVESANVSLYISAVDNRPVNPTLYVYLTDGSTVIGSASAVVSTTGWLYLDMGNIDHIFEAGNYSTLIIDVPNTRGSTSITISYDSQEYDSRIDMLTDTFVNVDDIRTYNSSSETMIFHAGDAVRILADVSDPFGSYDISGAQISVWSPNGSALIYQEPMNSERYNESSIRFSYNYTLPDNAPSGEYSIEVRGIESNGVVASSNSYFIVPARWDVLLYPDSSSTVEPNSFAVYNITLENIGEENDTYTILAGNSTSYWRTELWEGNGEIAYDSDGDGRWDWVNSSYDGDGDGVPEIYLPSGASTGLLVKKYVPPSSEGMNDVTYLYAVSETDSNVSDSVKLTTNALSGAITKTLHLHSDDSMDTFTGSATSTVRIYNGEEHTWMQSEPFYTDFNITSSVRVYLYIDPTAATGWFSQGNPDVTVSLYHNGSSIGSATLSDLVDAGWYEFTISVGSGVNIQKGERISLNISVSSAAAGWRGSPGYVDIYYDSEQYDSRVVMPTDTYVDVETIKTYNSTGETEIFYGGEVAHIVANISDPFGYNDISGAEITILDPDGNVLVHGENMSFISGTGANATFSYDFQTYNDSKGGEYTIYVTGIESNGVTDTSAGRFIIPSEYGVSVYPDQTKQGQPNEVIDFNFTVENIGNTNDTYEMHLSPSPEGWSSELWNGSEEVAYDSDGDGLFDWVNPSYDPDNDGYPEFSISSFESINLTLKRSVPADAGSVTDSVRLIAISENNSSVSDGARATINCPFPYNTKTLHLHSDDSMDTFAGNNSSTVQINNGEYHVWTQAPSFAMDFNISSYIPVYLYIAPTAATGWFNQGNPDVTVELSYGGTAIGSDVISDISAEGWYLFTIDAGDITIPSGEFIRLNVSVSSAAGGWFGSDGYITVYYDSQDYDSRVELPTDTVVKVENISTYNSSSETDIFSAGETVTVRSIVSDPLGAQDISGAKISIISPDGSILINEDSMSLEYTDISSPPAWNRYVYNYTLPQDAVSGEYQIKITGVESNGVINQMYGSFFIPCGVSVEPDHTANASSPSTVYFNHTVTNTGMGANIFELTLISQNGYNVSLYSSDGTLIGYDSNGDGVWEYVNPDYDTDGNGIPDTGILLPGESFEITVAVQIPENVTVWENLTVSAESFFGSCYDSAQDSVYVPEFSNIAIPGIFTLVLVFLIIRKKRNI